MGSVRRLILEGFGLSLVIPLVAAPVCGVPCGWIWAVLDSLGFTPTNPPVMATARFLIAVFGYPFGAWLLIGATFGVIYLGYLAVLLAYRDSDSTYAAKTQGGLGQLSTVRTIAALQLLLHAAIAILCVGSCVFLFAGISWLIYKPVYWGFSKLVVMVGGFGVLADASVFVSHVFLIAIGLSVCALVVRLRERREAIQFKVARLTKSQ